MRVSQAVRDAQKSAGRAMPIVEVPSVTPKPFIKWVGGKRQLLPELHKSLPEEFGHYYEPFIGGGALFFNLRARGWKGAATLGDGNERLVRTYLGVRDNVEAVIGELSVMRYDRGSYLHERGLNIDGMGDVNVAAWFIYLNKCGFNGLYRVNRKGEFNVPFGRYDNPLICDAPGLRAASRALRNTGLCSGDFEKTVKHAEAGDLVYFDPPYVPVNTTANFTSYTRDGFTMDDQLRLQDCAWRLKRRGVHVVLSNADVPKVRELYRHFNIRRVEARRNVNSKAAGRGKVGEVVIT